MYIPEFWCGVIALFVVEVVGIFAYGAYCTNVKKKEEQEEE